MPESYTCTHCRAVFVIPHLAAHPNRNHKPGCPLRTETQR